MKDLVGSIMAYEAGELSDAGVLRLFASLVESGDAWTLQGSYGRTATALIQAGFLTRSGRITEYAMERVPELAGEGVPDAT